MALMGAGCSTIPQGARTPAPLQVLLRATLSPTCLDPSGCPVIDPVRVAGPMVFADADSVLLTNMADGRRVVIRSGPAVRLEVYRGQRAASVGTVARESVKGAGLGLLAGLASGLVGSAVAQMVGFDSSTLDMGSWIRTGAVTGATAGTAQGLARGASEGDGVWEVVSVHELRQLLCSCAEPDPTPTHGPARPLVP